MGSFLQHHRWWLALLAAAPFFFSSAGHLLAADALAARVRTLGSNPSPTKAKQPHFGVTSSTFGKRHVQPSFLLEWLCSLDISGIWPHGCGFLQFLGVP